MGLDSPNSDQYRQKDRNEFCKSMTHYMQTKTLKVIYFNARSIVNKLVELQLIMSTEVPDVICITESWLNDKIMDAELTALGFRVAVRKDRFDTLGGRGRGTLILTRNVLSLEITVQFPGVCGVRVGDFDLYCCYLSPNADQAHRSSMNQFVSNLTRRSVVVGDFNYPNIEWSSAGTSSQEGWSFLDATYKSFMMQLVDFPTHDAGNMLDQMLTNDIRNISYLIGRPDLKMSDHIPFDFGLEIRAQFEDTTEWVLNYGRANYESFRRFLDEFNWLEIWHHCDVERAWYDIKEPLYMGIDEYVPKRPRREKSRPVWLNHSLLEKIRRKGRLYKKFRATGLPAHHDEFKKVSANVKKNVRRAKEEYEEKLASSENLRSFYGYIRSNNKATDKVGPLMDDVGVLHAENGSMAALLNGHFVNRVLSLNEFLHEGLSWIEESEVGLHYFTAGEVYEAIRKKKSSASGPDGISFSLLQGLGMSVAKPLAALFNLSLISGKVPHDWKEANVYPLFKGGDKRLLRNYRPISLTSSVCKVMEGILKKQLTSFLEDTGFILDTQHGFRHHRSCQTNLISHHNFVSKAVDAGSAVDTVYLDFSRAFDSVSHRLLLNKVRASGIGGFVGRWIQDWLVGRMQRVVLNGTNSDRETIRSGIPQGSVLGPLLFTIFVNDLSVKLPVRMLKFADDAKIFCNVSSQEDRLALQENLDRVVEWANDNNMKFNEIKSKVLRFGRASIPCGYAAHGSVLEEVNVQKDLGVMTDGLLRFSKHSSSIAAKARGLIYRFKRAFITRKAEVLMKVFNTYVRPLVEASSPVWNPGLMKDIHAIERTQRSFTKALDGFRNLSYPERLRRLQLEDLESRRKKLDLTLVWKVFNGTAAVEGEFEFVGGETQVQTRASANNLIKGPAFRKLCRKNTFFVRVIPWWNSLPSSIRSSQTLKEFKTRIKSHEF